MLLPHLLWVMVEVVAVGVVWAIDTLIALLLERVVVELMLRADAAGYRHPRHGKVRDPDRVRLSPEWHVNWHTVGWRGIRIRMGMSVGRNHRPGQRKPRAGGDDGRCCSGSCGIRR